MTWLLVLVSFVLIIVLGWDGRVAGLLPVVMFITAMTLIVAALNVLQLVTLGRAVRALREAKSEVVSGLIDVSDRRVAEVMAELRSFGFEMAGAVDTTLGSSPPIRTWVFVDAVGPGTTWAEVGQARHVMAIFLSRGADGRFLETSHPDGEDIDHPNLFAVNVTEGVSAALDTHRRTLAAWEERAGPARVIRTIDDYRVVEDEMRDRTAGMRVEANLERVVKPTIRRWVPTAVVCVVGTLIVVLVGSPPA